VNDVSCLAISFGAEARNYKMGVCSLEFVKSISLTGWMVIVVLFLFAWFGVWRKLHRPSKLNDDIEKKRSKMASYVPPPSGNHY